MLQYSNVHHNFEAMYAIINLVEKFLTNKFDSKNKKICTFRVFQLGHMVHKVTRTNLSDHEFM